MRWLLQLPKKARSGSRPRCILMMDGPPAEVAIRLSQLIGLAAVGVSADDKWMPRGTPTRREDGGWDLRCADEAKLGSPNELLPLDVRKELKDWWLAVTNRANTPNWDIASTCTIKGKAGLLLVEAKAHHGELEYEDGGKRTVGNERNHERIGTCIADASREISRETCLKWKLSRDSRYQMSNRFAWAWRLTQLGYPVILVYLGFVNATEMGNGRRLISDASDWGTAIHNHSRPLFPADVWNREWIVNRVPLIPLIRTMEVPLAPDLGNEGLELISTASRNVLREA
ncbi:MAG: hypothetical protein NTY19_16035 [Planctomycetota bacterium]|nr:hypothetical protein [Planctomycetota bacterium]